MHAVDFTSLVHLPDLERFRRIKFGILDALATILLM